MNLNKETIHKFQELFYDAVIIFSYVLIFITTLGINDSDKYLQIINYYIKIYICLFLIWRFNPLRKHYEFTSLDRKIAFNAGTLILTTTTLNTYIYDIKKYINTLLKYIKA